MPTASSTVHTLRVWGDFACFTRPEMKVERVSYPLPTPSAARGILEAVFWKPAMRWCVEEIALLRDIRWMNLRRNEVGYVLPAKTARSVMRGTSDEELALDIDEERQQRSARILKDVEYLVRARIEVTGRERNRNPLGKFDAIFERRAARGQCYHRPYLGCREFSAHFELLDPALDPPAPLPHDQDLGWMFYGYDYRADPPRPRFFRAHVRHGRLSVPSPEAEEVRA